MSSIHSAFSPLPLGAVTPSGWLRRQLQIQADGLSGSIEELWDDLGPDSGWLGGDGESWERGPYYLDGLIPLAHLLGDEALIAKGRKWIEWMLQSQQPSGQFGPSSNDDWWTRMVAAKVLQQHAEATGDERVLPFLERYYEFQLRELPGRPLQSWAAARAIDNVLALAWVHERSPRPEWTELARLLLIQGLDWDDALGDGLITGRAMGFDHRTHGPNVAMALKNPAVRAMMLGEGDPHQETLRALANLDRWHGMVHGMFSGEEWLAGREAARGVETCQVVEYMFTMQIAARVTGEATYSDLLEGAAYNLLPASSDPLMRAHQYHQQANQIEASTADRNWAYSTNGANVFGLEPHFGCCTANYHQGWPKFIAALWMTADDTLSITAYGPSRVEAEIGGGVLTIVEETDYPFDETIVFRIEASTAERDVALRLRIPEWASDATLTVNGAEISVEADPSGYILVSRRWSAGDEVALTLPMRPRRVKRERQAVGVRLGPLVMVATGGENWYPVPDAKGMGEWEVFPRRSWNFALYPDATVPLEQWSVLRSDVPDVPFGRDGIPVSIQAAGVRDLAEWQRDGANAGNPPDSPVAARWINLVPLVPYGSATIRIAEFPTVVPVVGAKMPAEFGR
ncbi:beta-L-arabinofuranosidase domain-containing protein [Microbacterium sp. LWH13-1.2]|uniref:beta-L-arabinofuranosidase domain-containing protein n=1 Tax=Microbacterium sp. LWH13-1.2 TaxID=3135260 RepID=UPI003139244B